MWQRACFCRYGRPISSRKKLTYFFWDVSKILRQVGFGGLGDADLGWQCLWWP